MRKIIRLILVNVFVFAIALIVSLAILEISFRSLYREYRFKNFITENYNLFLSTYPVQFDPYLGWSPRPGLTEKENLWGTKVSISRDGIRSNGNSVQLESALDPMPVLAVGDSFTFGDQVSDDQTWPAALETLLNKKVINGGVCGYGVDQSFLRAKQLIKKYKPGILIFGISPDDVYRCQLKERTGVAKPYFDVVNDKLILRNVPVPYSPRIEMDFIRRIFGYSYLAHSIMMRTMPDYWLKGKWRSVQANSDGEKVACMLMRDLDAFARENNVGSVYLLIQYVKEAGSNGLIIADHIINGIGNTSIKVIDMRYKLMELKLNNKDEYDKMFNSHMTYSGNKFTAKYIYSLMKE